MSMTIPYRSRWSRATRASARSPSRRGAASRAARRAASVPGKRPRPSGRTRTGRCTRRSAAACPARSGSRAACTSTPSPTCPSGAAADFGARRARVERAILALGDVARVHLYRWGDGGAHFHVWFLPRPLGMVEASGMMLPLWEDVLPNVPDEELAAAAERVAAAM